MGLQMYLQLIDKGLGLAIFVHKSFRFTYFVILFRLMSANYSMTKCSVKSFRRIKLLSRNGEGELTLCESKIIFSCTLSRGRTVHINTGSAWRSSWDRGWQVSLLKNDFAKLKMGLFVIWGYTHLGFDSELKICQSMHGHLSVNILTETNDGNVTCISVTVEQTSSTIRPRSAEFDDVSKWRALYVTVLLYDPHDLSYCGFCT